MTRERAELIGCLLRIAAEMERAALTGSEASFDMDSVRAIRAAAQLIGPYPAPDPVGDATRVLWTPPIKPS